MPDRLKNKVALVTGGGTGIGRSIAVIFAREGAKVAVSGRTVDTLNDVVNQITREGGQALAIVGDVSKTHDAERMVRETVQCFGQLDVLVNNAGVRGSIRTVLDLTEEEWQRTFDIDAKGSWLCSKYAIPEMRKTGGGAIIMVSSISAHIGQTKQGCYNAAKAAQELLMKCMALDFAPDHIRVNSICPAWVETEMNREQLAQMKADPDRSFPPGFSYRYITQTLHPVGRVGTPQDCAWAAVYLASDESSWVTGSSLMIDGGFTCQ
jgi:meso-butanediol dehydrogenase/(S,S)-butanediol dehydrogenase/diacetyl reductase